MPVGRVPVRRAQSRAIDNKVLDAAVLVVKDLGPDELTFSAVARTAGLTTGAVYARFENRQELLLDVWEKRAAETVKRLTDLAILIARGEQGAAVEAATLLQAKDPRAMAGIALLIAAPRVEELEEALLPQVRSWFDEPLGDRAVDGGAVREALVIIAYLYGAIAFDAAINAPTRDWRSPLLLAAQHALPPPQHHLAGDEPDAMVDLLQVDTGDERRDQLLTSMATIVARSGLKRATTSRIARAAGFQQGAIFTIWANRTAMVEDFTQVALRGMSRSTAPAGAQAVAGQTQQASQGLARILGPAFKRTRRLRLEFVLAAMSDPTVATLVAQSDDTAVAAMAGQDPAGRAIAEAVRAVVLGLVILEETVGGCAGLDFTPPVTALLAAVQPSR
jgi:AcrR family transcriptional regulator